MRPPSVSPRAQADGLLRSTGTRRTEPRMAVLEALQEAAVTRRHPTAEELYLSLNGSGHDASLATVYRVLSQLGSAGLVRRLQSRDGKSCFELGDVDPHFRAVLVDGGRIVEFRDPELMALLDQVVARLGLERVNPTVTLYVRERGPDAPEAG